MTEGDRSVLCAIIVAMLLSLIPAARGDPHQTYQATGVVCDTAEQVARYVRSQDGDKTLAAINADSPNACARLNIAFLMGQTGEHIRIISGTWVLTQILVVGLDIGNGIQPVQPIVQWSAFAIEEEGA
jgi:hypothetical protein